MSRRSCGGQIELDVYDPQDAHGKAANPIGTFYDAPNYIVFSTPVQAKTKPFRVSFDDARIQQTLGQACGFAGRGDAVMLKK